MATYDNILNICGYDPVTGLNGDGEYSGIIPDFEGGGVEKSTTTTTSSESSITIRYEIGKISIDLSKFNEDHNGGYLMTKLDINNISLRGEEGSYSLPSEDPISYDLLINRSGYNHRIEGAGKFTPGLDGSAPVITFDSTSIGIYPNPDRESTDLRISGEDGKTKIEYIVILEFKIPSNNEFLKAIFTDGSDISFKSKPKKFEGSYIWQINNTDPKNDDRDGNYLVDNQGVNYYGYLITGENDGSVPDGGGDVLDTLYGGLFIGYKGKPIGAAKVKCAYSVGANPNDNDWTDPSVLSEELFPINASFGDYEGICIALEDNSDIIEVEYGGLISPDDILKPILTQQVIDKGISFAFQFVDKNGITLGDKSWYYVGSLDSEGIKNLYRYNEIQQIIGPNHGSLFIGCETDFINEYIDENGSKKDNYQFRYELSNDPNFGDSEESIIITPDLIKVGTNIEFTTIGNHLGIKISGVELEDLREGATNGLGLYIRLYISDYENIDDRITTSLDKTIIWNSTINKNVFTSINTGADRSITDAEIVPGVLYVGYNKAKLEGYGITDDYNWAKCKISFFNGNDLTYTDTKYFRTIDIYNISTTKGESKCVAISGTILNDYLKEKNFEKAKFNIIYSKDETGENDSNISFTAGYLYQKDVDYINNGKNVALCSSTGAISEGGSEGDTFYEWNVYHTEDGEGFPEQPISSTVTLYEKTYGDSDYEIAVGDTITITKEDIDALTCKTHISAFIEVDMGNGLAYESFEVYPGVANDLVYDKNDWEDFENNKLITGYTNPKITITLDNGGEIIIPADENPNEFTTKPIEINGHITGVKLTADINTPDYTEDQSYIQSAILDLAFKYHNLTDYITGDWQPTIYFIDWDRYYYETSGKINASINAGEAPNLLIEKYPKDSFKAEGGTDEISYKISNPIDGAEVLVTHNDWVDDVKNNFSDNRGTITFVVGKNDAQSKREGSITITYAKNGNEYISKEIIISQEGTVHEPKLSIIEKPNEFDAAGGTGKITYEILNPVNGAEISVSTNNDWVDDVKNNFSNNRGTITFTVKENTNTSRREGSITITYTYGNQNSIEEIIGISQDVNEISWGTLKLQYKSSDIDVELTETERNYVRWSPNNKGSQLVGEFESLTKENDFYTVSINGDKLKSLINLYPNGTNMYMEFSSDKSSLSKYYLIGELTTDIINILKGGENYTIQSSTNRGELKIGYRAIDIDNEIGELDRQYIKWSSNIGESGSWIRPILDGDYYSIKFNYNELSKLISYITNNRNNSITLSLIFSPDEEGSNLFEYKIGDFTSNHRESIITGTSVTLTNYTRGYHQFILDGDGIFIIDGATGVKYDLLETLKKYGVKIN